LIDEADYDFEIKAKVANLGKPFEAKETITTAKAGRFNSTVGFDNITTDSAQVTYS